MLRRDRIFFAACGIFAVGLALAALGQDLALLFFVAAYLLRPTLHAFDLAGRFADERQVQIHSRSGNIAFIAVMLAAVGIALAHLAKGEQPEELYAIIAIGIAARAVTGLLLGGEFRKAAATMIIVVASCVALFVFASNGFSAASLFFGGVALLFVGLGAAALRFPRTIASVLAAAALGLIFALRLYEFRTVNLATWMVVACLLIAALFLYRGSQSESDEYPKRSRSVRMVGLIVGATTLVAIFVFLSLGTEKVPGKLNSSGQAVSGPVDVQGVPCVGHVDYYPNGKLKSSTLAREDTLSGQPLAAGTIVTLTPEGVLDWCFLLKDTEIQGHLCKGKGDDWKTCFYPNGKLRVAWLGREEEIQGIPVKEWSFWSEVFGGGAGTYFWDNGNLRRCKLSRDCTVEGRSFKRGDVLGFDQNGKLIGKD